jgi:hypothetical protein
VPENFSSILESLAAEGREKARPKLSTEVAALGRARQRRRRGLTVAVSTLAACAVAVGVTVGVGGSKGSTPVTPGTSATSAREVDPPLWYPTTSNRLLKADELPNPGAFQWSSDGVTHEPYAMKQGDMRMCIWGDKELSGSPPLSYRSRDYAIYDSGTAGIQAFGAVMDYSSKAAAEHDYALLAPDLSLCNPDETGRKTATIKNGYAWVQNSKEVGIDAPSNTAGHAMVYLSGKSIAVWYIQESGTGPGYDTSDDQLALQRMADRLDGKTPVPPTNTALPPDTIVDSNFIATAQIPFKTADKSLEGWVTMGRDPATGLHNIPPSDLCAFGAQDIVSEAGAVGSAGQQYHGTPQNTPDYPGTTYLYSGADETIRTYQDAPTAQGVFTAARHVTNLIGCTFKDEIHGGNLVTRAIKVGTVTATGFSLQVTDKPGPSYEHVYVVVKGKNVAELIIDFLQGDNSMAGDAAVLDALAARLP